MFLVLLLAVQAIPAPMPGPGAAPLAVTSMKPDLLLAALLLSTPPGVPESPPHPDVWPAVRDGLHQVAVEWEILDPRETRYVLVRPEDYSPDLDMLRQRYRDLKDAPRVDDCHRFPDRETANSLVRFNRSFRKNVADRRESEPDGERAAVFDLVLRETDQLYAAWDCVRDARCEFFYVVCRRKSLKKLRDLLGDEDYRDAVLPSNVPTWRFNDLK